MLPRKYWTQHMCIAHTSHIHIAVNEMAIIAQQQRFAQNPFSLNKFSYGFCNLLPRQRHELFSYIYASNNNNILCRHCVCESVRLAFISGDGGVCTKLSTRAAGWVKHTHNRRQQNDISYLASRPIPSLDFGELTDGMSCNSLARTEEASILRLDGWPINRGKYIVTIHTHKPETDRAREQQQHAFVHKRT